MSVRTQWAVALATLSGFGFAASSARAVLIESFETGADGYTVSSEQSANFQINGASTTGATDGLSSLAIGATASNTGSGPSYQQLLVSPSTNALTAVLGASNTIMVDVTVPAAAFGYYLQFDAVVNNADTGYTSLDGYAFGASATIGGTKTVSFAIPAAIKAQLAASAAPTSIVLQVGGGYTAGNETFYLDNLRTDSVAATPEPATLAAAGAIGTVACVRRRRRSI